MPANAGRSRMPHNNRVHTSASLNTNSIWKDAIGYDPYKNDNGNVAQDKQEEGQEQFKSLLKLVANNNQGSSRGVWKGSRPLKGVFAEPQFGYQGVGTKEMEDNVEIESVSSDSSSDSENEERRSVKRKRKSSKKKKKSKKRKKASKKRKRRHRSVSEDESDGYESDSESDSDDSRRRGKHSSHRKRKSSRKHKRKRRTRSRH